MLKVFMFFAALTMLFVPSNLKEIKDNAMFYAYNNGYQIEITQDSHRRIEDLLCASLKNARRMPALGVSLHDETMQDLQSGIWIRFKFDKTYEIDGLPFDDLLVKIRKDMYGTNIIRGNNGVYEGRCFYIDLKFNCDGLLDFMSTLPVTDKKFELESQNNFESKQDNMILQFLQSDDDDFDSRGKHAIPLNSVEKSCKHEPDKNFSRQLTQKTDN